MELSTSSCWGASLDPGIILMSVLVGLVAAGWLTSRGATTSACILAALVVVELVAAQTWVQRGWPHGELMLDPLVAFADLAPATGALAVGTLAMGLMYRTGRAVSVGPIAAWGVSGAILGVLAGCGAMFAILVLQRP